VSRWMWVCRLTSCPPPCPLTPAPLTLTCWQQQQQQAHWQQQQQQQQQEEQQEQQEQQEVSCSSTCRPTGRQQQCWQD